MAVLEIERRVPGACVPAGGSFPPHFVSVFCVCACLTAHSWAQEMRVQMPFVGGGGFSVPTPVTMQILAVCLPPTPTPAPHRKARP